MVSAKDIMICDNKKFWTQVECERSFFGDQHRFFIASSLRRTLQLSCLGERPAVDTFLLPKQCPRGQREPGVRFKSEGVPMLIDLCPSMAQILFVLKGLASCAIDVPKLIIAS